MIRFFSLLILTLGFGSRSWGACASPQGTAGEMKYQSGSLQFSDGCIWNTANLGTTATTCSTAGEIKSNASTSLQWCDGAHYVNAATSSSQTNGSCSTLGAIAWDNTNKWKQWCDGTNWRAMQAPHSTAGITSNAQGSTGNSFPSSLTLGGTFSAGKTIICAMQTDTGKTVTNVTDTRGNSYQRLLQHANSWGDTDEIWAAYNTNAGTGNTITVTYSAGATFWVQQCAEFTGIVTTNPLDAIGIDDQIAAANYLTVNPTVTTTSSKELVFAYNSAAGLAALSSNFNTFANAGSCPVGNFFVETAGTYSFPQYCNANCTGYILTFRTTSTTTAQSSHTCQTYLTGSGTWTVPSDWNSSNNKIEAIGAGGGGSSNGATSGGGGGGAGAYSKITNLTLTAGASISYTVGTGGGANTAGGDSYFNGATCSGASVCANGGGGASTTTGGTGGLAAVGVGTTKVNGGYGNNNSSLKGGGGGGAGGTNPGNPISAGGTTQTGGAADGGTGGAGGGASLDGSPGREFDYAHGSGGGGGGGPSGGGGGDGGVYGGGGGGAGKNGSPGHGAVGLISVTWNGTICK